MQTEQSLAAPEGVQKKTSLWQSRWMRRFRRDKLAATGIILVLLLTLIALFAPYLAPYDPAQQHIIHRLKGPSDQFKMGTDEFGRDVLSRLIYGSRASLTVGVTSVLLAGILGTIIGGVAGYVGG